MIKVVVCALAVIALAGCPGPMSVRYPSDPAEPTGTAELSIAAGPTEKQLSVWVSEDNPVTIPMGSAGGSATDTIKGLLSSIAGILVYALLFR